MLELTPSEITTFLDEQRIGRIGCAADGAIYVVPVTYAYADGSVYVLTTDGQKIEMMRANPHVCFEIDRYDGPGSWRSVIAYGRFEELDEDGVERARTLLVERMRRDANGAQRPSRPASGKPVIGFRIRIDSATGRAVTPA